MTKKKASDAELLSTLGDFTSRENWDKFFTVRGSGADPFEWYVDWPTLRGPLLSLLSDAASAGDNAGIQILVPGCGNSQLSEFLYDAGFHHVTNIDFSKVVISDMLRRHVRERPEMRWRIMDMTNMHGGVEPLWVYSTQPSLAKQEGRGLLQLLEIENKIRTECSSGMSDIVYSFEDLLLGVKGDLKVLAPGRRIQVTLGEHGESLFSYKAVLLDSKQQSDPFRYNCGVFLVPNKDLSPLVKDLAPGGLDGGAQFPWEKGLDMDNVDNDGDNSIKVVHEE
ncbi:hypothetical protein ACLOJK_037948 [Asimina triloba]